MLAVPNRPQKTNGWSWSFQQWHTRWLGCYCISNSYRHRRWVYRWRVVKAYTLVGVQHPLYTVVT